METAVPGSRPHGREQQVDALVQGLVRRCSLPDESLPTAYAWAGALVAAADWSGRELRLSDCKFYPAGGWYWFGIRIWRRLGPSDFGFALTTRHIPTIRVRVPARSVAETVSYVCGRRPDWHFRLDDADSAVRIWHHGTYVDNFRGYRGHPAIDYAAWNVLRPE